MSTNRRTLAMLAVRSGALPLGLVLSFATRGLPGGSDNNEGSEACLGKTRPWRDCGRPGPLTPNRSPTSARRSRSPLPFRNPACRT